MSSGQHDMSVIKRDGTRQDVAFDKILIRVKKVGAEANIQIRYSALVMKIIDQLYDGIHTTQIDELTAQQCASQCTVHPDYGTLAGRIIISNNHKNTHTSFYEKMKLLHEFKDVRGNPCPFLNDDFMNVVSDNKERIQDMIDYERDYLIDYFGFKTLERSYLFRLNNAIIERPQDMWMRVSIAVHGSNMEKVMTTYDLLSNKYFTHATPTLYNSGTRCQQMSSCYLIAMEDDSIEGIYNTLKDCANISKYAGGIGLHIHNIRASGTLIRGTNGTSNGIVPMLRVFNNTARYVDQCVVPTTYIYTDKGPIHIENVVANETKIVNEHGDMEIIENVLEHSYSGSMLSIKTMHSIDPLIITKEHPILVLSGQKQGLDYTVIKKHLENKTIDLEWKDASNLTKEDMLVYSIPKYVKDISNITEDDCYIYGVLLGDGYLYNDTEYGYISLHSINKIHIVDFCRKYFNSKCVNYKIHVDGNTTRVRWTKNTVLPFRYGEMYTHDKQKYIHNKWLHLPIHKIQYIVKGLIDTDGCKHNEVVFDNTSRILIEGLRYLLLRMGIPTSGYIRDRIGEEHMTENGLIKNHQLSYCLCIPITEFIKNLINYHNDEDSDGKINKSCCNFFTCDNNIFTRIKDIDEINYTGTLYDLQMKDVHSYTIHNGVIHNGGGRRNGSFAIYLEPWHADIFSFLEMRKNHGDEELKARDLFYALWIPDLFMKRVNEDGNWSLMCPNKCPGLADVYGDDFEKLYTEYERSDLVVKTVKARDLWFAIMDSQMETGTPYLLYKDACNKKSNQKNLGTIKSSNLCTEIVEYSDDKETAVCNLASISLSNFVDESTKTFDYEKLISVTKVVTENLNKIIDMNFYPTEKTKISNNKHRPIGIGVQGLADTFFKMDIAFGSKESKEVNKMIFETIYFAACTMSCELSIAKFESNDGAGNGKWNTMGAYSSFDGSPMSKGLFQFDLWGVKPDTDRYDWDGLREKIMKYGMVNSLLLAPMPTASTAQILGNNECFEPITSNLYSRRTMAGEFIVVNKYLMKALIDEGIWNEDIKNSIIVNKGSVQHIEGLSEHVKNKYKIVWEIKMKDVIDMAADRGKYICQSQSMNLWISDPNYGNLTSMHFYAWNKGLKTGMYYLRRKAKHQAQQFTVDPTKNENTGDTENEDPCEMCSS